MSNKITAKEFFKEYILQVVSIGSSLAVILSISYNFGYFSAIDISLMERLTLSDYLSSFIPFVFPALGIAMGIVLVNVYFHFYPPEIILKNRQKEQTIFESDNQIYKLQYLTEQIHKNEKLLLVSLVVLEILLTITWYLIFKPSLLTLLLSLMLAPSIIFIGLLMKALRSYVDNLVCNLLVIFMLLLFIFMIIGAVNGNRILMNIPNMNLIYGGETERKSSKITLIKSAENDLIFLEKGAIKILSQDKVIELSHKASCPTGWLYAWLAERHSDLKITRPDCF